MDINKLSDKVAQMAIDKLLPLLGMDEHIGVKKAMIILGIKSRKTLAKYINEYGINVTRKDNNHRTFSRSEIMKLKLRIG